MYPFERFTEDAKKVLTLAREEAEGGHRPHIGTEHLLLGIIRGPDPARRRSPRWTSGSKRCGSPSIGSLAERTSRPSTRSVEPLGAEVEVAALFFLGYI